MMNILMLNSVSGIFKEDVSCVVYPPVSQSHNTGGNEYDECILFSQRNTRVTTVWS